MDFRPRIPPLQFVWQSLLEADLGAHLVDLRGLLDRLRRLLLLPCVQHRSLLQGYHWEPGPSSVAGHSYLRETGIGAKNEITFNTQEWRKKVPRKIDNLDTNLWVLRHFFSYSKSIFLTFFLFLFSSSVSFPSLSKSPRSRLCRTWISRWPHFWLGAYRQLCPDRSKPRTAISCRSQSAGQRKIYQILQSRFHSAIFSFRFDSAISRTDFNGSYDALMDAVSPRCSEFIFECQFENMVLTPDQCCTAVFDPNPIYNEYGKIKVERFLRTYMQQWLLLEAKQFDWRKNAQHSSLASSCQVHWPDHFFKEKKTESAHSPWLIRKKSNKTRNRVSQK